MRGLVRELTPRPLLRDAAIEGMKHMDGATALATI